MITEVATLDRTHSNQWRVCGLVDDIGMDENGVSRHIKLDIWITKCVDEDYVPNSNENELFILFDDDIWCIQRFFSTPEVNISYPRFDVTAIDYYLSIGIPEFIWSMVYFLTDDWTTRDNLLAGTSEFIHYGGTGR